MFWKIINRAVSLTVCLGLFALLSVVAFADADTSIPTSTDGIDSPVDFAGSKSAILVESGTLQSILAETADEKFDVAGLARMPGLLAICEAVDAGTYSLDTIVTVSKAAADVSGPTAFIDANERIGARDLLKAAIMISAGDAIYALCESYFGTPSAALGKINARLSELDISCDYDSLNGEGIKLSAGDLVKLGVALSESETFCSYGAVYMDEIVHENGSRTELVNPNRLVRSSTGCIGIGTGSSGSAGYCGVFAVKRSDTSYVCAVVGAQNSDSRFAVASQMIEYAFSAYKSIALLEAGQVVYEGMAVRGGEEAAVDIVAIEDIVLLLKQNEAYERNVNLPEYLEAPVSMDMPVGTVEYVGPNGNVIAKAELFVKSEIKEASLWNNVLEIMRGWLHG